MKTKLLSLIVFLCITTSCTENQRAKALGGTMTVKLPVGTTFVNATWKEDELWYIYRPRKAGETPDTTIMQEDSKFGLIEGTVQFIEQ
jgi:hypothetical protein